MHPCCVQRCTFFVSIIFCHQLFNASINFKCIKFSTPKQENQAHTYMYTQAHTYVSPVNIRWYLKKVPFVLAFNFISPHDYWHVTRMHILKMIWINRCFRQHQMMWSFRTIKLHYWNCQLIWKNENDALKSSGFLYFSFDSLEFNIRTII